MPGTAEHFDIVALSVSEVNIQHAFHRRTKVIQRLGVDGENLRHREV